MSSPLTIYGKKIERGQHTVVRVPLTVDLDDNTVTLTVHAVAGSKPGPTLAITSVLHGEDWQTIEVIRRLLARLKPADMTGTLLVVPVGNPLALAQLTRVTPDGTDTPDLNRIFPGAHKTIADQLARAIATEVMAPADALIDFHSGMWGATHGMVIQGIGFPDAGVNDACRAMARAFGWPSINENKFVQNVSTRTSSGYFAGVLGKPSITPEIGGSGFDRALEDVWIDAKVDGTLNVMKHMGILADKPATPEKYLVWQKHWWVNPSKGGYLVPAVQPERLNTDVAKGELLGTIVSPYSFEEIERLEAPGRGSIYYIGRPYPMRPGRWAFGVVDLDDPNTRWE